MLREECGGRVWARGGRREAPRPFLQEKPRKADASSWWGTLSRSGRPALQGLAPPSPRHPGGLPAASGPRGPCSALAPGGGRGQRRLPRDVRALDGEAAGHVSATLSASSSLCPRGRKPVLFLVRVRARCHLACSSVPSCATWVESETSLDLSSSSRWLGAVTCVTGVQARPGTSSTKPSAAWDQRQGSTSPAPGSTCSRALCHRLARPRAAPGTCCWSAGL